MCPSFAPFTEEHTVSNTTVARLDPPGGLGAFSCLSPKIHLYPADTLGYIKQLFGSGLGAFS